MRVAIYTRISTDEDHQPFSLEAQEIRLRSYIASQDGWELVRIFTDQASGASVERPDLQRALREARAGRFDVLLVYRVDRFSRRLRSLVELLDQLDKAGVAFRSATEPFDTSTPAGRMMVQMLGVFAEFERATIIDRVVAGMERRAARGAWNGGVSPYGYNIDKQTGFLDPRDDESPLVPIIFRHYVHDRFGAREIGNVLSRQGHRTRAGVPWNHSAVLTILRNPVYVGKVFYRGVFHDAPHPPLIDQETFDAAQRILDERGENYSKRRANKSDYLLAGLIFCGRCGKRYQGGTATGNRYTYRYYTCFSRQRYGSTTCDSERLPADEVEQAVLDALVTTYERHDLIEEAVAAARQQASANLGQSEHELAAVTAEIAKADDAIERYLSAFEAGTMPEARCGERVRRLGDRVAELRHRQATLAAAVEEATIPTPSAADLEVMRDRIGPVVREGSPAMRKALLAELVSEVRVEGRDTVVPWFRVLSDGDSDHRPAPDGNTKAKVRVLEGVVGASGIEPETSAMSTLRSYQLSYAPTVAAAP